MRPSTRWVAAAAALLTAAPALATTGGAARTSSTSAGAALRRSAPCAPASPGVHTVAPGAGRTVALTFDDGPGPSTPAILRILARHRVAATFFNIGENIARLPGLVRQEAAEGYALGNHSWDHPDLALLDDAGQRSEMRRASAQQAAALGSRPCLFRPPYGGYDATTLALAASAGMTTWDWSVDTEDWKAQGSAASAWVTRIVSRAEAGGSQRHPVILMHNQATPNPATVAALPRVIAFYRARGYRFVDLFGRSELRPSPALARTAAGLAELSVHDGVLKMRRRRADGWSHARGLAAGVQDAPAAIAVEPDVLAVAVRGADDRLRVLGVHDDGSAQSVRLGGRVAARPAITQSRAGRLSVVVRRTDDAVWLREATYGRWARWHRLGGHFVRAPAVAATRGHGLVVAAVDSAGQVEVRRRSAGGWSRWHPLSGHAFGDLALAAAPDGRLLLATRSPAGTLRTRTRTAAGWGRWHDVAGALSSSPQLFVDRAAVRVLALRPGRGAAQDVAPLSLSSWSGWRRLGR